MFSMQSALDRMWTATPNAVHNGWSLLYHLAILRPFFELLDGGPNHSSARMVRETSVVMAGYLGREVVVFQLLRALQPDHSLTSKTTLPCKPTRTFSLHTIAIDNTKRAFSFKRSCLGVKAKWIHGTQSACKLLLLRPCRHLRLTEQVVFERAIALMLHKTTSPSIPRGKATPW